MASITIRRLDEGTKDWLRRRAATRGRSVESEVRHLLASERARDEPDIAEVYPPGLEPLPGEGVGSWIYRISRPGYETEYPDRKAEVLRDPFE